MPHLRASISACFALSLTAALPLGGCSFDIMGNGDDKPKVVRPAYEPADAATHAKMLAYMEANKAKPGMTVLDTGIQYKVLNKGPGTGRKATWASTVMVRYKGSLIDGKVFDQTEAAGAPATLELNQLVEGWQQVIPLMRDGDKWEIYLPPEYGYGSSGSRTGSIPPDQVLIFEIELVGLK